MKQEQQQVPIAKDSTNAPYWVCWPLHLTIEEIKSPDAIIHRFFQQYTLAEIRMLLQDWLQIVFEQRAEAAGYVSLCRDVERLIEALFMTQRNEQSESILELLEAHN